MKTVDVAGEVRRLPDWQAHNLVTIGKAHYVPKSVFKRLKGVKVTTSLKKAPPTGAGKETVTTSKE